MRRFGWSVFALSLACGTTGDGDQKGPEPEARGAAEPGPQQAKGDPQGGDAKADDEPAAKDDAEPVDAKADDTEPAEAGLAEAEVPEISPTRALILADGKLLRLAPSGRTELLADAPGMVGCDHDDDHRVVWLVSAETVAAYDPEDGKVHPVARGFESPGGPYGDLAWQVQRQSGSPFPRMTAGNADGIDDCVALVVLVDPKPRVGGAIIAEGDREWYCFENDEDVGEDPEDQTLNADEAKIKAGYDEATMVGEPYLVALHGRHAARGPRSRPAPEAPPAPEPAVDRSQCEEVEEDCGTARYVGGGRLWEVITANSRGDFYHEDRYLYDAKTSSWWDPATGTTSKTPHGESGIAASPDATWGLYGDKIFSLAELEVIGSVSGQLCGWE